MRQKDFVDALDQARLVAAISAAEKRTSGEIRIHVQPHGGSDIRTTATKTFERLGMTRTAERNGVLLFIASEEQRFVILGDAGIDEKVPGGFWDEIAARLTIRFKAGEFTEGIIDAVHAAGEQLRHYFPRTSDDVDELSNDVSIQH